MIRIENIIFTLEQLANAKQVLLLSVKPYKLYSDGQVTDQIGGHSYECVMPMAGFEKIMVKVPNLPAVIATEQISDQTFVTFDGFSGKFWRDRTGNYQLSCKAEKAILVNQGASK